MKRQRSAWRWMHRIGSIATIAALGVLSACGSNHSGTQSTMSIPVTFNVVNMNRSAVVCPVDGQPYEIHGHLVGPDSLLSDHAPTAATLYLHGIGWGEFYWHFTANPDVDYASQMARLGHVSVVYDQLGYGASGRPAGLEACYGGDADIAAQMIDALRTGSYVIDGSSGAVPKFARVALAAQQAHNLTTEPEATTFKNIDALLITSFSDDPTAFKPAFLEQSAPFFSACAIGGEQSDGTSGPNFYEYFPPDPAQFMQLNFSDADPAVVATATGLRGRSPCGEGLSAFTGIGEDQLQPVLQNVTAPVLIVNGSNDAFFTQPQGGDYEKSLFSGSSDVTVALIANGGQALALEHSAPEFRTVMDTWLTAHGF